MMFPGLQGGNQLQFGGMMPRPNPMPVRGTMAPMGPVGGNTLNLSSVAHPPMQPVGQPIAAHPQPFMPPQPGSVQGTMAGAPQGQPAQGTMLPYSQPYIPPFMMPPRRAF